MLKGGCGMTQIARSVPSYGYAMGWDGDPPCVWPGEFIEEPAPVRWFDDSLSIGVSHLGVSPGPGSAAALAAMDPSSLDDDGLLTVIGAWRRLGSWAKAGELAAVAALLDERTRGGGGVRAFESAVSEIQLELT